MSSSDIKVLHLVGSELAAGASRGAYSLHRSLLAKGIHSRILSDNSASLSDETVFTISNNQMERWARIWRWKVEVFPLRFYPNREKIIFSTGFGGYDFTKSSAFAEATIIHLHWINGGFVSMRQLRNINKPIIWTMRDMWPMTGGCHYSMGCEKYIDHCGKCPQLHSTTRFDLSRIVNNSKQKYIPKSVKLVGISRWLSECAKESSLFKSHDVRTISNNIDTQEFFPVEKSIARLILEIKTDKKIILAGAQKLSDFYKGFDKFLAAIGHLDKSKYHLCFFGNINRQLLTELEFSFSEFGFLHDTVSLRLAYSAADVFVAPSIMEAFGKTLAEAMACGTPVVCFDATGPRDIVDHMVNGYRAIPFDPVDIARGIEWICHHENSAELARSARSKSIAFFDSSIIADQYIELYQDMLDHESTI